MAAPAAVLSILVKANTGQATQGLARFNAQLGGTQSNANKALGAVKTFAKGAAVATGIGLGYAVKKAADFEEQLDSLGAVTQATGRQMERLRKQAMKAGADTKFSALEAAKAQTELAKGGLKIKQVLDGGLNSALALAAAGEMDLADAAATTANALNLFGLRGRDSIKVADALAKAANDTTADVADFAMALTQSGGVAKTAGLSFHETVLALEALAKSGVKNSDAGTSLKTSIIQLLAPSSKQKELADKLNVSFKDQAGNFKNLSDVSDMLRAKTEGMTKAQRIAAFATLAGTDGVRTLTALYDAGSGRLDKWRKGLNEAGTAAEVAARKQDNLKGKLENLRGSVETAAIAIGTELLPTLTRAATKLTKVINDPNLTNAEKFQRLSEMMGEAIEKAIPLMAESAAKAAPVVVGAFIKGFLASGIWGRLAIAGFLLAKMGGPPAFLKVGTQVGTHMGTGMATGVASSGLKGRLVGLMRGWGPTLGIALAAALGPEFVKKAKQGLSSGSQTFDLPKRMSEPIGSLIGPLGDLEGKLADLIDGEKMAKLRAFGDTAEDAFNKARKAGDAFKLGALSTYARKLAIEFPKSATQLNNFADAADDAAKKAGGSFRDLSRMSAKSLDQIRKAAFLTGFKIKNTLGPDSKAAKEALARNFAGAAQAVRKYMQASGKTTKEGTRLIEQYMVEALRNMGFSRKEALTLRKGQDPYTGKAIGGKQNLTGKQRGGPINLGAPSGDSVPAMLERGEYVLNRTAVRKVGRRSLDKLNFGAAPRFQGGGIVELLHPGNDKNHQDHLHVAMNSVAAIVALGHKLQKLGWLVGEHPAFGGVGGHTAGSYHYKGLAIDVNWPDAGQERSKIAALLPLLGGSLGSMGAAAVAAVAPKLTRMLVEGPDSPLKSLAQRALDTTRIGAQAKLNAAAGMSSSGEGAEMGSSFSGPWSSVMAQIAKSRGWSLPAWQRLVQKESGGNPKARNPSSGAFGLGQFLGATAQAYAKYGALSTDPVQQIQAMAKYISDRYGNPSNALAFHEGHNWYSQGGVVGMQAGGGDYWRSRTRRSSPRATGRLGRNFSKALKVLGAGKNSKIRTAAVDKLLRKIKAIGLPAGLTRVLGSAAKDSNVFGEYADRASILTSEDANGNPIPGVVNGKSQTEWLTNQLEALLRWRNALVRAAKIAAAKRAAVLRAIELARATKRTLDDRLKVLGKKPKQNRKQITALTRQRNAVTQRILPALVTRATDLNTSRSDILSNLETVQGIGSPMGVLKTLPTMGVLGGTILNVQSSLRDLNAPRTVVTDTDATSERSSLLEGMVSEANRRALLANLQLGTLLPELRGFVGKLPQYGGTYATGGVVPGPRGAARVIEAHAGEGVFTADQMSAMGGRANIQVIVHGDIVSDYPDPVEVVIGDRRFKAAVAKESNSQVGQTVGLAFQSPGVPGVRAKY